MKAFTQHTGLVAPLDRANVDTDQIIPKQFLKSIKRTGFGPNLFDEWRYLDVGQPYQDNSKRPLNKDFVLNAERYQDALPDVLAAPCAALRALLAWSATPADAESPCEHGADLRALADRAGNLNNVVRTPAHRALLLAERAPAIGRATRLNVADREDVETGWYTARNVVRTVAAELRAAGA